MKLTSLISNPRRQQFFSLLIFYAAYLWFRSFSSSVLGPHFLEQAVSIKQMILGNVWFFLAGALTLLLLKQLSSRPAWRWAIVLAFVGILVIIKIDYLWQFYLCNILLGINMVLFFAPYNIVHFQLTPKTRTIAVHTAQNQHLGYLPDDLSHRLIKLMRLGNKYTAIVRGSGKNSLNILIRETFRSKRSSAPSFSLPQSNTFSQ